MKNITSIPITFEVNEEISHSDGRYIQVVVTMMHLGKNLNNSIFTKDVVEENLDTIKNIPILGFVEMLPNGEKDFKGHEYILTKTENGIERVYKGSCYGVIPEGCNPRWVTKTDQFNEEHEYLQVDGLLWSKLEGANILLDDGLKSVSMELFPASVDGHENEDGTFVFTKFSFDGVCILGDNVQEAMSGADIVIKDVQFSMSDFTKSIQEELNNIYTTFTELKLVNEKTNQGGIEAMPNTNSVAQFENISAMVRQHEMFTNKFNEEHSRFEVVDICENEVVVVDKMNNYNCFGLSFATNDDGETEIDFENAKKKKICFEDCAENDVVHEDAFDFGKHIEEIESIAFAKVEEANTKVSEFEIAKNEIEEKYNQINAEFEEMKPKYDDYVKAEQARINAELEAQKDAEFAKYETVLADDVNFAALREKRAEMTVKEIEGECAILYARKSLAQANFAKVNDGVMTASLIQDGETEGFVYSDRYGAIPVTVKR